MKAYVVGGAVRDRLLGLPVNDRDWVVVGSTPEAMVEAGYTPVGRDFPVFLHPQTHEEYALARTERKAGRGYLGFVVLASPEVTLAQDLARRDLTINAIAEDPATGELIDPFNGQQDLQLRLLRHVGPAFVEDPVRLLRLARLAARFADFSVAPETQTLLITMVADGEVDALVPERVWQELSRGLMEARPDRLLEVLRGCGALARLLPEVDRLWGVPQPEAKSTPGRPKLTCSPSGGWPPQRGGLGGDDHPEIDTGVHLLMVLRMAARLQAPLAVRYACLCHDLGKGMAPADALPCPIGHEARSAHLARAVSQRWRVPADCAALADLVAREHGNVHRSAEFNAAATVRLLGRCDAWRRPGRIADLLLACECDARGRLGRQDQPYPQRQRLLQALAACRAVPGAEVSAAAAARGLSGPAIGAALMQARVAAVQQALHTPPDR